MTNIVKQDFDFITDNKGIGKAVQLITLFNDKIKLKTLNLGATISSLQVLRSGKFDDIVLGYDGMSCYVNDAYYLGCTVGRCANRIAKGKYLVDGKEHSLPVNNGPNHLHGGFKGFNKVIWDYDVKDNKVIFNYTSPDMEESYPGTLKCAVTFELDDNEVIIHYYATSTKKTPVNLTNHSYFNLGGHDSGPVHDHLITIYADYYTPIDKNSVPTGEILPVASSPFDLRKPKAISTILKEIPEGVDHNFCVNGNFGDGVERKVSRVEHPSTGTIMEVYSTQPGVQFYTANFLPDDDSLIGKHGKCYKKHGAFCLETQNYPDAVNHANFPNVFLDKGEEYKHTTRFRFLQK